MDNIIKFEKISQFNRGILEKLLEDGYSFDSRYKDKWMDEWHKFDDFFFDNLDLADQCGFITMLNDKAIGFVSWDSRNIPESAEIGFNCISAKYKNQGYGKLQLQEAINRIVEKGAIKVIVTTDDILIPAQHMYEGVGFQLVEKRKNEDTTDFVRDYLDYVYYAE